jgi:Protein of unknown function (DUF2914)
MRATIAAAVLVLAVWDGPAHSQEKPDSIISVEDAVIAKDVEDLVPVTPGHSFDSDVGRLYCFTRIKTSHPPAVVKHLWFYGDKMVMEISLPIRSTSWRTYSNKTILPNATGLWRVDITSEDGTVLESLNFTIR